MNYNYLTNNFPYNIRNILNNRNIDNQPNTTIPPNINRTTFNSTSNNETSSSRSLYDRTLYNTMNDRYVRITSDGIQYVPGSIWIEYRIRRDIEEERIRDQTRITLLNEIEGILNRLERRRNREGMRERVRNYRNINTNTSENENNVSTTTNQDSRSEQNSENRANQNLYDTTLNSTDNSNINTSVNSTLDTTINDILIRNPNIFSIGVSSYSTRNQDLEQGETNEQRNIYSRQFTRNSNIALNNTFMEIINTAIEDTFNINLESFSDLITDTETLTKSIGAELQQIQAGLQEQTNTPSRGGNKKNTGKKKTTGKKKNTGKKKTTGKKVRKIYKGPRGGKYYITKGRKVYI